jgi:hypothetical protein
MSARSQRRFVLADEETPGSRACAREDITSTLPPKQRPKDPLSPAEFLGKLWSVFGPTEEADEGFEGYDILDSQTGRKFRAYSGASGPAYRALEPYDGELRASLADFERVLSAAPLADCALEYDTDFGRTRIGVSGGKPFEQKMGPPEPRAHKAVETVEQALALVPPKPGDPMREVLAFWPGLYMTVVPALQRARPTFDDLRADPTAPRIDAVFRDRGKEVLVPVEQLKILGLSDVGLIWLEAYKQWIARHPK